MTIEHDKLFIIREEKKFRIFFSVGVFCVNDSSHIVTSCHEVVTLMLKKLHHPDLVPQSANELFPWQHDVYSN